MYEKAWEAHQKLGVSLIISAMTGFSSENFCILTLFDKVKAISIAKFVLGSVNCRFSNSYTVMAIHTSSQELTLAQIQYFARVHVHQPLDYKNLSYWVACVCFHYQHEYKDMIWRTK